MSPSTGEILALAVYPSFDLNNPMHIVDYYDPKIAKAARINPMISANRAQRRFIS